MQPRVQYKAEFSPLHWELTDTREQLFAGGAEHCPSWLMERASPSLKMRTLCTPPGYYSHPIVITTNRNKLNLQEREAILALQALLSII